MTQMANYLVARIDRNRTKHGTASMLPNSISKPNCISEFNDLSKTYQVNRTALILDAVVCH